MPKDNTLPADDRPDDQENEPVHLEDMGPAHPEVDPHTESDPKPVEEQNV